jgi:DNA-binding LytR/AlgR family response regulator
MQMPGLDGFGVLASLAADLPAVIFVTAFDRYALKASRACGRLPDETLLERAPHDAVSVPAPIDRART